MVYKPAKTLMTDFSHNSLISESDTPFNEVEISAPLLFNGSSHVGLMPFLKSDIEVMKDHFPFINTLILEVHYFILVWDLEPPK